MRQPRVEECHVLPSMMSCGIGDVVAIVSAFGSNADLCVNRLKINE